MSTKDLDFGNVIKQVYDPPTESLKVLATISIGSISVDLDAATDSIRLGDGTLLNTLTFVGGRNAIDVNIAGGNLALTLDQADDSIKLGDGTTLFTSTTVGPKIGLDVSLINSSLPLPAGASTEAKQDTAISAINALGTLLAGTLAVTGPLTNTELRASPVPVSVTGVATEAKQDAGNASLASIDSKLTSPLTVSGTVSVNEPLQISGTDDGLSTGNEYGFVYNQRQQVLAADDREDTYTYADYGTKNQRITRVDYTSPTFPGIIVRRDFNYVLDGNSYRRTDSPWSIV